MSSIQNGNCSVISTDQHKIVTKENIASLVPDSDEIKNGTVVHLKCYTSTYVLNGSSKVTCISGKWKPDLPTCIHKTNTTISSPNITNIIKEPDTYGIEASRIILIVTASICAAIIIFFVAVLLYRCYLWRIESKSSVKSNFATSTLPLYTISSESTVLRSTWSGNPLGWTYISVDQLIRDIERSRRENPRHSWRDFASMSAYSTKSM